MALQRIKNQRINPSPFHPGMILRISLFVSFLFHLMIVLAFQQAFWSKRTGDVLRSYTVELIRPPVKDMDVDDIPETDIAQLHHESRSFKEEDQDTISLDTDDERYVTYARIIKKKIMRHWKYPPKAREYLLEGRLMAVFSLKRNGQMIKIEVLENSGYEVLDDEAVRAIRTAAPFPLFPENITVNRLNIKARFNYRLTNKK